MKTATQLRQRIAADPRYSHLARLPIDWAISEIRVLRALDAQYLRTLDRARGGRNDQDRSSQ
jgi:hypothetical protein